MNTKTKENTNNNTVSNTNKIKGFFNFMDFFSSKDILSHDTISYNKKNAIKIKRHSQKLTIYTNKKFIKQIEKEIKDYRSIIDIYIEESNSLTNTLKIVVGDNEKTIEKQIL